LEDQAEFLDSIGLKAKAKLEKLFEKKGELEKTKMLGDETDEKAKNDVDKFNKKQRMNADVTDRSLKSVNDKSDRILRSANKKLTEIVPLKILKNNSLLNIFYIVLHIIEKK
jgi:hypothetical protein